MEGKKEALDEGREKKGQEEHKSLSQVAGINWTTKGDPRTGTSSTNP